MMIALHVLVLELPSTDRADSELVRLLTERAVLVVGWLVACCPSHDSLPWLVVSGEYLPQCRAYVLVKSRHCPSP